MTAVSCRQHEMSFSSAVNFRKTTSDIPKSNYTIEQRLLTVFGRINFHKQGRQIPLKISHRTRSRISLSWEGGNSNGSLGTLKVCDVRCKMCSKVGQYCRCAGNSYSTNVNNSAEGNKALVASRYSNLEEKGDICLNAISTTLSMKPERIQIS